MKRVLPISLALNLVLFAALAWRGGAPGAMPRTPRSDVGEPARFSFHRDPQFAARGNQPPTPWQAIDAHDLKQLIANLRAIGCPEATIRDLVVFRVSRAARQRVLELEAQAAADWDYTRNADPLATQRRLSAERLIRSEMIATVESALGGRWNDIQFALLGWGAPGLDDGMGTLSPEQRRQVRDVEEHYSQLANELQQKGYQGNFGPEENTRRRAMEVEKLAALAQVLSPSELQDYGYHHSEAADFVRQNLPAAKSEAEFRAIVDLAGKYGMMNNPPWLQAPFAPPAADDPVAVDYQARRVQFDQALLASLGADRIAEQQAEEQVRAEQERQQQAAKNLENERAQMTDLAATVGIAPEDASRFFDRLKGSESAYQAKFDELQKSLTGTKEEVDRQMQLAIKAEFEKIAVEVLGDKGRALTAKIAAREGL